MNVKRKLFKVLDNDMTSPFQHYPFEIAVAQFV